MFINPPRERVERVEGEGVVNMDEAALGVQNWREWKMELSNISTTERKFNLKPLRKKVPGREAEIEIEFDPNIAI